jgi:hypothetical protein
MGKVTWGLHWVIQIHREVVATWMDVALDLRYVFFSLLFEKKRSSVIR